MPVSFKALGLLLSEINIYDGLMRSNILYWKDAVND
jgi:hypothetical protein